MDSKGQLAIAQRLEVGRLEWAAEHAAVLQGTVAAAEEILGSGDEELPLVSAPGLPSQRMHSKGWQGNQTRSLPVSR
uniref:Uncharacterized protein MANES_02G039000 n=1 Tax=Rhizophora mucronata TaxID=61149 RepID=A0A2P2NGA9_RHIMU